MIFIGIDIGTTNWKIAGYDISGKTISSYKIPTKVHSDKFGDFYLPDEIWDSVCFLIKKIISDVKDKEKIISLCVGSIGESLVLLDKAGKPLYLTIAWYDKRTEKELKQIEDKITEQELFKITGLYPSYIYSLLKLLWIKNNFPDVFKKIKQILSVSDYINYKLTGEKRYDFSQASRTMLFDIEYKKWSDKILNIFEIDKKNLPELLPSGKIIGNITKKAQDQTGLSKNTKVILGGHDHIVGAFGAGVIDENEILDSIGTAEGIFRPLNKIHNIEKIYKSNFSVGANVFPDKYYLMGGIYSSGGLIEFFLKELVKENYVSLINLAKKSPVGSKGLFVLPHLLGSGPPHRDVFSRASFLGINAKHKRQDFARAIFECLCYESRVMIDGMEDIFNEDIKRIVVIGGGTKNKLWMEIKCDVLGKAIEVQEDIDSVCFGAALVSAYGLKIHNIQEIKNLANKYLVKYNCNKENFKKYTLYYNSIYKKIYPTLKEINSKISNLFSC